jgi:hypothetical protein
MTDKKIIHGSGETHKYCAKCAALMVLERVMPTFGPLPEIRLYRCLRCGSMVDENLYR